MLKQTIIDNEFITMWYHPDEKILHHQFHTRVIFGEYFRGALNKGSELLKENNACKWLSDDRTNVVFTQEDMIWGMHDWSSRALEAGWKYWAIVKPRHAFGMISFDEFIHDYKQKGLIIELFDDVEKAFEWLKEQ
jgi:hypothetical protein